MYNLDEYRRLVRRVRDLCSRMTLMEAIFECARATSGKRHITIDTTNMGHALDGKMQDLVL